MLPRSASLPSLRGPTDSCSVRLGASGLVPPSLLRPAARRLSGPTTCRCALHSRATEDELAVADDIFRQASRLTRVCAWVATLLLLVLLVVLLR